MKRFLTIAATCILASAAQAISWEVLCVKQGPVRGYDARSLKPGNASLPIRPLAPGAGNPGNTTGYPIGARSIPGQASVADNSDITGDMNFISLGFGGQIVLRASEWFCNGPGADVTVFETTWGDPTCRPTNSEQALVQFSEDGVNWITPGVTPGSSGTAVDGSGGLYNTCYNGSFDIAPLMKAQYVRITDRTNPAWNVGGDGVDAYDVDGVTSNYSGCDQAPQPVVCDYRQGVASQFATGTYPYTADPANVAGRGIVSQRKDFSKANINEAGFPVAAFANPGLRDSGPSNGSYNFWSLGFGGYACFKLPYTVFDGPGKDIYSFETTWNNQPCPNYNEKARVQVSADGVNWSTAVTICKDALSIAGTSEAIDLADFGPGFGIINYIRYEDASAPSDFGGGADSYDIDNIALAQIAPVPPPFTPPFNCDSPELTPTPIEPGDVWEYCIDCQCNDSWKTTIGGWNTGSAPFGNVSGAGIGGVTDFNYNTLWSADNLNDGYDLRVRRKVNLSGYDLNSFSWNLGITGGYVLYVNGHVVSVSLGTGYPYRWEFNGTIPSAYLNAGDNVIALALMNDGPNNAFDFRLNGTPTTSARMAQPVGTNNFMEGGIPEEMFALELVGGSVVSDKISFKATIAEEGGYKYSVRSATGQEVISGNFAGNLFETPVAEIVCSKLNSGVYFLTLSSSNSKETVKFIKK
jgi:hypothetical protein